jgi:sugar O-acyltransferase (sialic acid O-acetyltransferase NeuD family)
MSKQVVIIGASGHGKVIADIVMKSGDTVRGFLDDNENICSVAGISVLGKIADFFNYKDCEFVIAIGYAAIREAIAEKLGAVKWYTAVHPAAVISGLDVEISEGTVIMANAVINPGTRIGKHCIINTAAVVEHDNNISDYVHISVGVRLGGTVSIGKASLVGIGSCVINNVSICGGCTIGAGAAVVNDIKEPGTYLGVPARKFI